MQHTQKGAIWVLIPALLLLPQLGAAAQAPRRGARDNAEQNAVAEYQLGRDHFEAGRYREAITHLERAVSLDPNSPTLVYNVGRVYELLGELGDAIRYYRTYLDLLGSDEDQDQDQDQDEERTRVALVIERLEGAQREAEATAPNPAPEDSHLDRPVLTEESGVADAAFWVTGGAAAVLLATGGALGAAALMSKSNAECTVGDQCTLVERDDYAATAQNLALGADILLIAGGVTAIAAVLLYALRTHVVETYPQYEGASAFFDTDGQGIIAGVRGAF